VAEKRFSPEQLQALDAFAARSGPGLASAPSLNVTHDEMKAACPDTMAVLDAALTIYTYTYSRYVMWPGRS